MTKSEFEGRLQHDIEEGAEVSVKEDGRIFVDGDYIKAKWDEEMAASMSSSHGQGSVEDMYGLIADAVDNFTGYKVNTDSDYDWKEE